MVKWVAAILGYSFFRFPGALLGFFLGSLVDQFNRDSTSYFRFSSTSPSLEKFQLNLLALAATIIKADGQIKKQELQFVRNFFISNYGTQRASSIFEMFNEQIKKKLQNTTDLAQFFMQNSRYETRLQIIHFLFGVANADGNVSPIELNKLEQIAAALGIASSDFQSILAMFVQATDNAYKVLEITPNATNEEVKKAYRIMAKKYHPDKIQSQDQAMIKGAKEKFQEVQKAYETIQKERGM